MKNIVLSAFAVSSIGCASIDYEPYVLEPEAQTEGVSESIEEVEDKNQESQ